MSETQAELFEELAPPEGPLARRRRLWAAVYYRQMSTPEGLHARRARWRIKGALASGRLSRSEACSTCSGPGPIEAHHPDYDRPLDVVWLCHACHMRCHARSADASQLAFAFEVRG